MTRRDYIFMSDEQARKIADRGWDPNETYLRSLVSNVSGDGSYADSLTWGRLQAEGRKILGIAKRRVEGLNRAQERSVETINTKKDSKDQGTRQLDLPFE